MYITQLIFLRPRETPKAYKDEGHGLEIGLIPLQQGDIRRWDDGVWQVAHVEAYDSLRETNNNFSLTVLTPDGRFALPRLTQLGNERSLYLYISSEDFALTWPEPAECLPEVGHEAPPLEGYAIDRIQEFVGDSDQLTYDRVLICWCVPVEAILLIESIAGYRASTA